MHDCAACEQWRFYRAWFDTCSQGAQKQTRQRHKHRGKGKGELQPRGTAGTTCSCSFFPKLSGMQLTSPELLPHLIFVLVTCILPVFLLFCSQHFMVYYFATISRRKTWCHMPNGNVYRRVVWSQLKTNPGAQPWTPVQGLSRTLETTFNGGGGGGARAWCTRSMLLVPFVEMGLLPLDKNWKEKPQNRLQCTSICPLFTWHCLYQHATGICSVIFQNSPWSMKRP